MNWELTEDVNYRTYRRRIFETRNKWDVPNSRQKELVKKLERNICYCLMARGRIGIPATPRTEPPMTISNCFLPIDIIRKNSIPDAAETVNSPLVIAILLSYCWAHTLGFRSTSGKSLSRSLICIIGSGFKVSCILIFTIPFDT